MPTDDRNLAEQTSATPYTGHDSWKAVDVSISPISHRFENLKWLGAYFGKTEISQRLFSKTENFRALRAPHAKSEATFVAREFKAAVRMCPQICAAAPPWVRLKNAMQNEGGPRTAQPRPQTIQESCLPTPRRRSARSLFGKAVLPTPRRLSGDSALPGHFGTPPPLSKSPPRLVVGEEARGQHAQSYRKKTCGKGTEHVYCRVAMIGCVFTTQMLTS
jgi:hypothetical protein